MRTFVEVKLIVFPALSPACFSRCLCRRRLSVPLSEPYCGLPVVKCSLQFSQPFQPIHLTEDNTDLGWCVWIRVRNAGFRRDPWSIITDYIYRDYPSSKDTLESNLAIARIVLPLSRSIVLTCLVQTFLRYRQRSRSFVNVLYILL